MNNSAQKKSGVSSEKMVLSEIGEIVSRITGVQFADRHQSMISSRLNRRISELKLDSIESYLEYFRGHEATETPELVSLLTTHHTYFFREFSQFEFMLEKALPALLPVIKNRADRTLKIWSAACSRGQEVYSLAMFLDYHLKRLAPGIKFSILGSDVDANSVKIAENAVYAWEELKEAPLSLVGSHWARGTGDISHFVKAKNSIRENCTFEVRNLSAPSAGAAEKFDIIFCRNVFIYFKQSQVKEISARLISSLHDEGFLFVGLSESLNGLSLPVKTSGPSVYIKSTNRTLNDQSAAPKLNRKIRVICVDDSPSIHTMLKRILSDEEGFEIVATAISGLDAAEKMKTVKADVMTLDIHMPEMDGVQYLKTYVNSAHPPVIMVTSVSRENSDLALSALKLGALDYIEKPSLSNLQEKADELRTKIRCVTQPDKGNSAATSLTLDQSFSKSLKVKEPDHCLRMIAMNLADQAKLKQILAGFQNYEPPVAILLEGGGEILNSLAQELSRKYNVSIIAPESMDRKIRPGQIMLFDLKNVLGTLKDIHRDDKLSVLIPGLLSKKSLELLTGLRPGQVVVSDSASPETLKPIQALITDRVPITSFYYLSLEYLCR